MKILIIALPRTGSTTLLYQIAKERKFRAFFEPFNLKENYYFNSTMDNIVVKTIVEQHSNNLDLAKDFDEVILLSRKDYRKHVESLSYLYYNIPNGYNSNKPYDYSVPPLEVVQKAEKRINEMNAELETLSEQLNIPIQYYEDLFDPNGPDRLRIKTNEKSLL